MEEVDQAEQERLDQKQVNITKLVISNCSNTLNLLYNFSFAILALLRG